MIYIDTSALVKTILDEAESPAFREYLVDKDAVFTSALTRIEFPRAIARGAPSRMTVALRRIQTLNYIGLSADILRSAAAVQPVTLRTLDAIHLASALSIRSELEALVAYDDRLLAAAASLGIPTASPR